MESKKNNRNEQRKQKQTHRYRERFGGCWMGGGWGSKGGEVKMRKLPVTKTVPGM